MLSGCTRRWRTMWVFLVALAAIAACATASAQATSVIYRCTDAKGDVTFQNDTPCPKGSQEVKRTVGSAPATTTAPPWVTAAPPTARPAPPTAPAVPAMPAPASPPSPEPTATTDRDPALRPPPPLFECRGWDNTTYLGDSAQPEPRCAPLQVTGLDGTAGMAAGSACQMVEDTCQPVPDAELCARWAQRVREADTQATFGDTDKRDAARAELERLRGIVRESRCAP